MARHVVIKYVCDRCSTEFEDDVLFHYEIGVPNTAKGKSIQYESDLCDDCAVMLDEYIEGFGFRPVPKAPKQKKAKEEAPKETSLVCGWNGCDFVGKNQMSISAHRNRRRHK